MGAVLLSTVPMVTVGAAFFTDASAGAPPNRPNYKECGRWTVFNVLHEWTLRELCLFSTQGLSDTSGDASYLVSEKGLVWHTEGNLR